MHVTKLQYNLCLPPHKASLQKRQPSSSNTQPEQEKLEKLESECLKLSRTQTLAEVIYYKVNSLNTYHLHKLNDKIISMQFCFQTKLAILEQKLLKEEHERKLVQEKAEEVSPYTLHQLNNDTRIHIFTLYLIKIKIKRLHKTQCLIMVKCQKRILEKKKDRL